MVRLGRKAYCGISNKKGAKAPPQALSCKALNGVKTFEHKKCLFCGSKQVKKDGKQNGKQRYKCHHCGKRFSSGKHIHPQALWQAYTVGKQTAAQLAEQYKCSRQTILRHLKAAIPKAQFATPSKANVIMDTTYFKRSFGIMVLMDSISGKALFVSEVKYEANELYAQAIGSLKTKGIAIQSIVCDGRRGLPQMFANMDIPVQLCQFHQVKTIIRYLTRHPKTEAGKALWRLVLTLKNSSQSDFQHHLQTWFEQYQSYLNERTINPETGKSRYTHQKLRSAYSSLKRNLDYLFVFEKYPELGVHNTTNLLDGAFAGLKRHLACHHGMNKENKVKFIKDYFSVSDDE